MSLNRMEAECLALLRTALRIKDMVSQGQTVTADAYDLLGRTEDVLTPMLTSLAGLPVVETRSPGAVQ